MKNIENNSRIPKKCSNLLKYLENKSLRNQCVVSWFNKLLLENIEISYPSGLGSAIILISIFIIYNNLYNLPKGDNSQILTDLCLNHTKSKGFREVINVKVAMNLFSTYIEDHLEAESTKP